MPLFIQKNPNSSTLLAKAYSDVCPANHEPATEEEAQAFIDSQLAAGWTPVIPVIAPVFPRADRDALLSDCDWTQLTDAQLTTSKKAEWAAYRQALRNAPSNWDGVLPVIWPTTPS